MSVPLVGWSHAQALARAADAHLVTQVRNHEAILRTGLVEGRDFTAIDTERLAAPMYRLASAIRGGDDKGWSALAAIGAVTYPYFEHLVWKRFRDDILARRFDVVHRITPLSPAFPSLLARRCRKAGVPFVLGPLNGGLPWPKEFAEAQRSEKEHLAALRGLSRFLPGYHATRRHSAAILVASRATLGQLPLRYHPKSVYIPENAIDPARFPESPRPPVSSPVRLAFAGRIVPVKGLDMLLDAAADLVRAGRITIDLIGDGPEREPLRRQAEALGISSAVSLDGWVAHTDLHTRLGRAHVLAFPSVKDFGGGAVLEGMVLGLVPIVVDYGGPGELVTDDCGFKVPIGPRDAVVAGLRQTLTMIVDRPEMLSAMGERARRRVLQHLTWDAKAKQVLEVYRWVTGRRPIKPDFGIPIGDDVTASLRA